MSTEGGARMVTGTNVAKWGIWWYEGGVLRDSPASFSVTRVPTA